MLTKKTIRDIDIAGKTLLIRTDYNVPFNEHGVISDDYRIRQTLPTINYALENDCKVIIISHLGRPEGKPNSSLSLRPASIKLAKLLKKPIKFIPDCIGQEVVNEIHKLQTGEIVMLENLRFHSQEELNDEEFARQLAEYADIFVQDGFGVAYRKHASTEAVTHYLPSVAGLLLEKEVNIISEAMQNPARPLAVIVGGLKVSDKIKMVEYFVSTADFVAVVGAMANTFLKASGLEVGNSLVESESLDLAKQVLKLAEKRTKTENFSFYLPRDVVVSKTKDCKSSTRVVDLNEHTWADINNYPKTPPPDSYTVQSDESIFDIGPMSAASIAGSLKMAKTVLWNGMAGVTETKAINGAADPFSHGTKIIIEALTGERAGDQNKPFTIAGGGDTVAYIESIAGLRERLGHISTGGGAALEVMAGNKLAGIEALLDKD